MLEITYTYESAHHELTFKGHACYDDQGKDIVCSYASAVMQTTAHILHRAFPLATMVDGMAGDVTLGFTPHNSTTTDFGRKIFDAVRSVLKELADQYPTNVRYREKISRRG